VRMTEGWWTWINRSGKPIWAEGPFLSPVWREDFDDNVKSWPVGENQAAKIVMDRSLYRMSSKTPSGYMEGLALPIDRAVDFSIAAQIKYDSQSQNESIGLAWDIKDMGNFYSFIIHPQGSYTIYRVKDGTAGLLAAWTTSSSIKKGSTYNKLEVRREDQTLKFYINESLVKTLPYETCSGTGVGFACYGAASLSVDWISLKQVVK
jgi:hypothetical protein